MSNIFEFPSSKKGEIAAEHQGSESAKEGWPPEEVVAAEITLDDILRDLSDELTELDQERQEGLEISEEGWNNFFEFQDRAKEFADAVKSVRCEVLKKLEEPEESDLEGLNEVKGRYIFSYKNGGWENFCFSMVVDEALRELLSPEYMHNLPYPFPEEVSPENPFRSKNNNSIKNYLARLAYERMLKELHKMPR